MKGDINFESIPNGVRVYGTDPDVSMDDLADAMFEGLLRREEKLREEGRSIFDKPEGDAMATVEERELTFGERAVGLTFNPSGDPKVNDLKVAAAAFINLCDALRQGAPPEVARMYSIAITEAQTAQMWAVKSATWKS